MHSTMQTIFPIFYNIFFTYVQYIIENSKKEEGICYEKW